MIVPPASSRPSSVPARAALDEAAALARRSRRATASRRRGAPERRPRRAWRRRARGARRRSARPSRRRGASAFSSGTSASARGESDDQQVGERSRRASVGARAPRAPRRARRRRARRRCGRAGSAASSRRCCATTACAEPVAVDGQAPPAARRRGRARRSARRGPVPATPASSTPLLAREPAGGRRGDRAVAAWSRRARARAASAPPVAAGGSGGDGATHRRAPAGSLDLGEHAVDRRRSRPRGDDPEHARRRRLDLDRRLVGLDLDDVCPAATRVAVRDEPAAHLRRPPSRSRAAGRAARSCARGARRRRRRRRRSGTPPRSRSGVQGIGTSSAATRSTGASR